MVEYFSANNFKPYCFMGLQGTKTQKAVVVPHKFRQITKLSYLKKQ